MKCSKDGSVRQSVLGFHFGHRHAGFILASHRLLYLLGDDLATHYNVPLAQQADQRRWRDVEFARERPGTFA